MKKKTKSRNEKNPDLHLINNYFRLREQELKSKSDKLAKQYAQFEREKKEHNDYHSRLKNKKLTQDSQLITKRTTPHSGNSSSSENSSGKNIIDIDYRYLEWLGKLDKRISERKRRPSERKKRPSLYDCLLDWEFMGEGVGYVSTLASQSETKAGKIAISNAILDAVLDTFSSLEAGFKTSDDTYVSDYLSKVPRTKKSDHDVYKRLELAEKLTTKISKKLSALILSFSSDSKIIRKRKRKRSSSSSSSGSLGDNVGNPIGNVKRAIETRPDRTDHPLHRVKSPKFKNMDHYWSIRNPLRYHHKTYLKKIKKK